MRERKVLWFQILLTGLCMTVATPVGCALFPQKAAIKLEELEPELQKVYLRINCASLLTNFRILWQTVAQKFPRHKIFYYNKGL
jgi:hypothetical protein